MPSRYDVFYNGGIYHIYNKSIDHKLIFSNNNCQEFINSFSYYRSELSSKLRFSKFKMLALDIYQIRWRELFYDNHFIVDILAFSLLPNHFHFVIKQLKERGIIRFMSNISNSLTRYYNEKNRRKGPIFLPQFRSKKVKGQAGLNYLTRYVHTNCYAHGVVERTEEIFSYPYSSIGAYMGLNNDLKINTDKVMHSFGYSSQKYKVFILNNAEEQRMLESVKYTVDWMR